MGRSASGALALVIVLVALRGSLEAQQPALKRELPPPPSEAPCRDANGPEPLASGPAVPRSEAEEVRARLDAASRAMVLGELPRARTLLEEARALHPEAAAIHFELARVAQALGDLDGAVEGYCRVLVLEPESADGREAAAGLDRLAPDLPDPIPAEARRAFSLGVSHFDAGDFRSAAEAFTHALSHLPDWPDALYNRGMAHLEAGALEAGRRDFEAYLALAPDDVDRMDVLERLAGAPPPHSRPRPATALVAGILVPGGGHLYAGRPLTGTAYLITAAGSVGVGVLHTRSRIECLSAPGPAGCPPDHVLDRSKTRPLLIPGLAMGIAVTAIGAIRAYRHAASSAPAPAVGEPGSTRRTIAGVGIAVAPAVHAGPGLAVRSWVEVPF